ncbi:hypothetical protein DIZ81_01895 [Legionella taurinensis]|uniref:Uncharacterized protein n=1 Tax=Legionella taurinensis TaxID=70611 RepID=A0A3A5LC21_9GAMM|nr:hypothetical protein [Legionella taurinensis]MDX1836377.1 hypothetical protein [Legionella taurinensis]PUT41874.1 hypothetical protein DB744_01900 [Legionella taurinensis]PUT44662.1 hypothetical protein DB746_01900 [Legionella taurinensis]PUT47982.1 hypothetical protein DB743_00060 [Legionella taurinensis]PUT48796.1 hypothetical protein DB745_01900 [Legionella taurinensis]
MKKRLVWNFEIDPTHAEQFPTLVPAAKESLRWEARYFWTENDIAVLNGLSDYYLDLTRYESKHREDTYHLLLPFDFNIKVRRGELLYKPLLDQTPLLLGFGKKIPLHEQPSEAVLPGTDGLSARQLLELIEKGSQLITVEKDALIHQLTHEPTIKLELSRLKLGSRIFFSACLEGRSQALVQALARHLFPDLKPCDYVRFLKQQVDHD